MSARPASGRRGALARTIQLARTIPVARTMPPALLTLLAPMTLLAAMTLFVAACGDAGRPDAAGESAAADAATRSDPATAAASDSPARSATSADTDSVAARAVLADSVRAALDRLVRGGGAADSAGAHTWFSAETARVVRSVAVDSVGHAVVDFADLRPLIPNASSSAGSEMLLNELNSTVFSATGVRSVEYRMEGSCDLFWEWLQYSCQTVTRGFIGDDATRSPRTNR